MIMNMVKVAAVVTATTMITTTVMITVRKVVAAETAVAVVINRVARLAVKEKGAPGRLFATLKSASIMRRRGFFRLIGNH